MTAILPVMWFRLWRSAAWRLTLSARGVQVNSNSWRWEDLTDCTVTSGRFWSNVEILCGDHILLRGVPNSAAQRLLALSKVAKDILTANLLVDQTLDDPHYISDHDRRNLVERLRAHTTWPGVNDPKRHINYLPELADQYLRAMKYIGGDRSEIDSRNQKYVEHELSEWSDWFSKIESKELTDEQARSTIIMEDRNLLVAAAGSGKTSTIIAKAAYALAKGYCQPSELLILAFNTRIRDELKQRLEARLSAVGLPTDITVETFHSFGNQQIKRLDKHARLAPWAADTRQEASHIQNLLKSLIEKDSNFAVALAQFCTVWIDSDEREKNEIMSAVGEQTFEKAHDLLKARATPAGTVPTYVTLARDTVRSLQELRICNWLTLMGIAYAYERPFEAAPLPQEWRSGYRPDFFYPDIDCWHEHFGLNKLGKAPPWFSKGKDPSRQTYEEEVQQKRTFLRKAKVAWFETTSSDFSDGTWENKLCTELTRRGLKPLFIGWERFAELSQDIEAVTKHIVALLASCLRHAKSNRLSFDVIKSKLEGHSSARARAFLRVFLPIFKAYQDDLRVNRLIDFEDMIALSADAFREGRIDHPYRLILVDEFQDVSNSRAELISSLLAKSPDIRLFAVGDDWQSIYRFAGADITAMTKFRERYGVTATTHLTRTFRSNQAIADTASRFIMRNPAQLKKTVQSKEPGNPRSVEVAFHLGDPKPMLLHKLDRLADMARDRGKKLSVTFLGRYGFLVPDDFEHWQAQYKQTLTLTALTIHKSKGLEADIIFLLGASNRNGQDFPSNKQDDPLLSLFMPMEDEMPWAEERRLLYVALTRARQKAYIVTPDGEASSFVTELVRTSAVFCTLFDGRSEITINDGKSHLKGAECPQCGKGTLLPKVSNFGRYVVCSRKGICSYKRNLAKSS